MLRKIEVENFHSICEKQCLDLVSYKNAPDHPNRLHKCPDGDENRTNIVSVIFGPNASGKSNLLRAISFLLQFAQGKVVWGNDVFAPYLPFNNKSARSLPTRISAEFEGSLVPDQPKCIYTYEIVLKNGLNGATVEYEALKYSPNKKMRRIFERKPTGYFVGKEFGIKSTDPRLSYVSPTRSTIPVLAEFNHSFSKELISRLALFQTNLDPNVEDRSEASETHITKYYKENPGVLKGLISKIKIMDLGIEDIKIDMVYDRLRASFTHTGHDLSLIYSFESSGTKNFYKLFPFLNYVLANGGLAVLDELDRDIHPLLLPEIVNWFHDPVTNPHAAQLIFSCHNATLLESLIKEEVFFTSKSYDGKTKVYGLKQIKEVRRDVNLYSKYISGAFGGVPKIG